MAKELGYGYVDDSKDVDYAYKKCIMILKTVECILFTIAAVSGVIISCMLGEYFTEGTENQHPVCAECKCHDYGTIKMEKK